MCKLLWGSKRIAKQRFHSLLTYGLQQPLQVRMGDAQADADLAVATREYTTLMDVVSEPPSPRPTDVPSPQISEPFLPQGAYENLAALAPSPTFSETYKYGL